MGQPQEAIDPNDPLSAGLNERFFSRSPGDHFRTRALSLIYLADSRGNAAPINAHDSLGQNVQNRLTEWQIDATAQHRISQSSFDEFLTIECFMLKHHLGESLLRNLLALLDSRKDFPPWLAMAHLNKPSEFRSRLKRLLEMWDKGETLKAALEWAFLPGRSQAEREFGAEATLKHQQHVEQWIKHFARFHLDTAAGYNAAKHGLGTVAAQTNVSIREDGSDTSSPPVVLLDDTTLETLEYTRGEAKGELVWSQVTRTVDIPGLLSDVLVGAQLFDSFWNVAKVRFLQESDGKIPLFDGPSPVEITSRGARPGGTFRIQVAVTHRVPGSSN